MKTNKKILSFLIAGALSCQSASTSTNAVKLVPIVAGTSLVAAAVLATAIGVPAATAIILHHNYKNTPELPNNITVADETDRFHPFKALKLEKDNVQYPGILRGFLVTGGSFQKIDKQMQVLLINKIIYLFNTIPKFYKMTRQTFNEFNLVIMTEIPAALTQETTDALDNQNWDTNTSKDSNTDSEEGVKELSAQGCYSANNNTIYMPESSVTVTDPDIIRGYHKNYIDSMPEVAPYIEKLVPAESMITHEMGHMFFRAFRKYIRKQENLKNVKFNRSMYSIEEWKKQILKIAREKYGYTGAGEISDYAKASDEEWFAELFNITFCGGLDAAHPLCAALWDLIETLTNNIE